MENQLIATQPKTIEAVIEAFNNLGEIEEALDEQIYPKQKAENLDAPDECEYSVTITAKQWQQFSRALTALERIISEVGTL